MKFIIVYITNPNLKTAKKVIDLLISKRLIACANYFPVRSAYRWKGKIENGKEIVVLAKTRKDNWKKVRDEVKKIHPYETPCIMKIEIETNKDFAEWIKKETK